MKVFSFSTDILVYVIKHVEFIKVKKDHLIVQQGDRGNWYVMFVVDCIEMNTLSTVPPNTEVFCTVYDYAEKVDLRKGRWNEKRKSWVPTPKRSENHLHHLKFGSPGPGPISQVG